MLKYPIYMYFSNRLISYPHLLLHIQKIVNVAITSEFNTIYSFQTNYKFIMLNLSNLTLILTQPSTLHIANKQLKISAGNSTTITKSIPRISGQGQINWDDVLSLPQTSEMIFEITTKHQFGYNPQELQAVVQGKIKLSDNSKDNKLKSYTANVYDLQGNKVGYLKANIKGTNHSLNASMMNLNTSKIFIKESKAEPVEVKQTSTPSNLPVKQEWLSLNSAIAHVDMVKGTKVKLVLKWGQSKIQTQQFASKSGEIVYIDSYKIKNASPEQKDTQLVIQLIDANTSSLLGTALLLISSTGVVSKKGSFNDSQGRLIGQIFVEGKTIIKFKQNPSSSLADNPQLVISPRQKEHQSSSFLKNSSVRKRSIINSNREIKFSKQVRFFANLQDKKNDNVSYQKSMKGSFDFKELRTNKFYRGASIGRGSKQDFTALASGKPGVGEYYLPSIWDRY